VWESRFRVEYVPDAAGPPPGARYEWFVIAREGADTIDPAEAGIADPIPNAPQLAIGKARPATVYRMVLTRVLAGNELVLPRVTIAFDTDGLVSFQVEHPEPTTDPEDITPAPSSGTIRPLPLPRDPSPGEPVGQKLQSARIWAEGIATAPKSPDLVLPVEYFQLALSKPRQHNVSLKTRTQTPLLDAEALYRAMHGAATRIPEGVPPEQVIAAWMAEKQRFLAAMDEYGQTDKTKLDWNQFTDEWQQEVMRVAPHRFREALFQAGLIVTAVLLEHEKLHIEAALTTGVRVAPGGAFASGGVVYTGPAIAGRSTTHHARSLSRMHYRYQLKLTRVRGY
jgi:hypothetical protein